MQWLKTFGTSDMDEEGHMVQETAESGYIVTGMSDCNYVSAWGKIWLLKTDASGTVVWDKKYEGTNGQTRVGLNHALQRHRSQQTRGDER